MNHFSCLLLSDYTYLVEQVKFTKITTNKRHNYLTLKAWYSHFSSTASGKPSSQKIVTTLVYNRKLFFFPNCSKMFSEFLENSKISS